MPLLEENIKLFTVQLFTLAGYHSKMFVYLFFIHIRASELLFWSNIVCESYSITFIYHGYHGEYNKVILQSQNNGK